MKVFVTFLLNLLMETKMNLFYKYEDERKIKIFSN